MARQNPWTKRMAAFALGLGLAMSMVILPCWWTIYRDHNPVCSEYKPDFISLYTAAVLVTSDRPALYDLERQRQVQQPIDPSRGSWVLPFFYPPFFALLLAPLAAFSFSAAFALMTLVNVALLMLGLVILSRKLRLSGAQKKWLVLSTLCNYGVYYALLEAQTSFIALILLVFFVTSLMRPASAKAGICSALMSFKPQLAIIPLIILIARRKWVALLWDVGVLGILGLISLSFIGIEGLERYVAASREAWSADNFLNIMRPEQPERMHNVRALAYYFVSTPWREYLWLVLALAVIAMIVSQCLLHIISHLGWFKILTGLILVAPHFHDHDMTLLIVPAAFLLKLGGDEVPPWVAFTLVVAGFLPLLNTLAYPHLPPLVPLVGVAYLLTDACQRIRLKP